jgi:hypothetical protein
MSFFGIFSGILAYGSLAFAADEPGKPLESLPGARSPLKQSAFVALPLKAVMPEGWLKTQLRIQADGLTGHLDEFWPDVGPDCGWLGGKGESWERSPYYLDGLLPLAHLLRDEKLLKKANDRIDWAIKSQRDDGQFGPAANDDWWSRMVMCKALAMHYEATGDSRVIPMLTRYFRYQLAELPKRPLKDWAPSRGGDNLLIVHWLYNQTGDKFLLDLAKLIFEQSFPWWQTQAAFPGKIPPGAPQVQPIKQLPMWTHGVNNAMGLKTAAIMYAQSGEEYLKNATRVGLDNLTRHHGQPSGVFSADEHMNGTSPTSGCELCTVLELMFSLEEAYRLEGDNAYADRLERLAYNALPSTFTEDMWAHQYDQQVNQVLVSIAKRKWSDNFDDANVYGLEPNFGCCTANMHQAWPKFVKSLAMATNDNGVALVAYGPCTVRARVGDGAKLVLSETTEYPFDGKISLKLKLDKKAEFPIVLRIPQWADGATVNVPGKPNFLQSKLQGGVFVTLKGEWSDGDEVELDLPMRVRLEGGHQGLVSVYRGPLLFGLKIDEQRSMIRGEAPHCDYEIRPQSAWNYGLVLDMKNPENSFRVETAEVSSVPWDGSKAPVRLTVPARKLPQWKLVDNSAGPIAGAPQDSDQPVEDVVLVPFGSTRLRIGAFPLAKPAEVK